jgi:hypothetical protein
MGMLQDEIVSCFGNYFILGSLTLNSFSGLCFEWVLVVDRGFNGLCLKWVSLVKLGFSGRISLQWFIFRVGLSG